MPSESMIWMGVVKTASVEATAAEALRFMSTENSEVATGGCKAPTGMEMSPVAPVVLSVPFTAVQPCTRSFEELSRNPALST